MSGNFSIINPDTFVIIGAASAEPAVTIHQNGDVTFGAGWTASNIGKEVVAVIDGIIASRAAEIARLKAIMLDEDLIWNAIYDCMDMDWSSRDAARAVVAAFQKEIDGES